MLKGKQGKHCVFSLGGKGGKKKDPIGPNSARNWGEKRRGKGLAFLGGKRGGKSFKTLHEGG